jgi:hypothetical protein
LRGDAGAAFAGSRNTVSIAPLNSSPSGGSAAADLTALAVRAGNLRAGVDRAVTPSGAGVASAARPS